jgi:hypothetical protein
VTAPHVVAAVVDLSTAEGAVLAGIATAVGAVLAALASARVPRRRAERARRRADTEAALDRAQATYDHVIGLLQAALQREVDDANRVRAALTRCREERDALLRDKEARRGSTRRAS